MRAGPRTQTFIALAACALLLVFALRLSDAADRNALTFDEPHYVGTGLYLWDSGDYNYAGTLFMHPPLAFHLASLPLLSLDLEEEEPVARDIGRTLLSGTEPGPEWVRWASRMPFVVLACWGALLMFLWAREVGGGWAGLFALALFTASPVLLASAALAHSDITVAVFFLQTFYTFWRWTERPGAGRLLICGLSLGLACISKLSGLILIPTLGLLLLSFEYRVWPLGRRVQEDSEPPGGGGFVWPGIRATVRLGVLLICATSVIWVSYGFSFASSEVTWGVLEGLLLPGYLHSLLFDVVANAQGRSIYFFGQLGDEGEFWYLLPVAWLLKTPLPFLLMIALALAARSSEARSGVGRISRFVILPLLVYLAVALFVLRVPLGVRYLLPILPLLDLFVASRLAPFRGRNGAAAWVLMVWMWGVGAFVHPHYLAFFNPLIGGPESAHRALVESNYDWGQALPALAEELEKRGHPEVWLAYFGNEPPARYGIKAKELRSCQPVTGTVAVSATLLRGLYDVSNPFTRAPEGCFDWLLEHDPVAQPGYAILLYEIPETEANGP